MESRGSRLGATALLTGRVKVDMVPPQTTETVKFVQIGFAFGSEGFELSWNINAFSS